MISIPFSLHQIELFYSLVPFENQGATQMTKDKTLQKQQSSAKVFSNVRNSNQLLFCRQDCQPKQQPQPQGQQNHNGGYDGLPIIYIILSIHLVILSIEVVEQLVASISILYHTSILASRLLIIQMHSRQQGYSLVGTHTPIYLGKYSIRQQR